MRGAFEQLDAVIASATAAERPALIVALSARLASLGAALAQAAPAAACSPDQNLDVAEAARRLGVSEVYVYRNAKRLPFTVREGRRLLFSERGLSRYLAQRTGKGPSTAADAASSRRPDA